MAWVDEFGVEKKDKSLIDKLSDGWKSVVDFVSPDAAPAIEAAGQVAEEKKKEEQPTSVDTPKAPTPKASPTDVLDTMSDMSSQQASKLYDSDYKKAASQILEEYKAAKDTLDRKELVETFANAFGMLLTGAYGLRTKQDMSGVKFDKTDWKSKLDQELEMMRTRLGSAKELRQIGREEFLDQQSADIAKAKAKAKEEEERTKQAKDSEELKRKAQNDKALADFRKQQLELAEKRLDVDKLRALPNKDPEIVAKEKAIEANTKAQRNAILKIQSRLETKGVDADTLKKDAMTLAGVLGVSDEDMKKHYGVWESKSDSVEFIQKNIKDALSKIEKDQLNKITELYTPVEKKADNTPDVSKDDKRRSKAIEILTNQKQPVTEENIQGVITALQKKGM